VARKRQNAGSLLQKLSDPGERVSFLADQA
jgi:hypothetical protein